MTKLPSLFDELVQHYGELLDQALEQRVYKVNYQLAESLRGAAMAAAVPGGEK